MLYIALFGTIVLSAQTQLNFDGIAHDFSIEVKKKRVDRVFNRDGVSTATETISINEGNFVGHLSASLPILGFGTKLKPGDPWNLRSKNWNVRVGAGLMLYNGNKLSIKPSYHLQVSYSRLEIVEFGIVFGGFVTIDNAISHATFIKPEVSYWISRTVGLSAGASIFNNERSTKNDLLTNPRATLGIKFKL